jgi:hypothetical protein
MLLAMVTTQLLVPVVQAATTQIHNVSVTPAAITFLANDPDLASVPGSMSGTITFRTTGGALDRTWRVDVQATSPDLLSCPNTIPISRIRVSCVSATADEGGTGACGSPFSLSTTAQTVASGTEGTKNATPYVVTLNFSFQDSWRYIATTTPCTVNLTYQIIAN